MGGPPSQGPVRDAVAGLPPIDAVLLSHDHHADNLDTAGRAVLATAATVVTTVAGATRLDGITVGLEPWTETQLEAPRRDGRPSTSPRHRAATARRSAGRSRGR